MKSFLVTAAATLVTVNAATCNTSKLSPLLIEPYTAQCTTAADYTFVSLTVPDTAVLARMCTIPSCIEFFTAVGALRLGNCTVGTLNVQDVLDTVGSICGLTISSDSKTSSVSSENVVVGDASSSSVSSVTSSPTCTRPVVSGAISTAFDLSGVNYAAAVLLLSMLFM